MKVPIDIGGSKAMVELEGDKFTMTLELQNKKQLRLEIENIAEVMGKVQQLTGRAAWELKSVMDELMRRVVEDAIKAGTPVALITLATVDALLQRVFPEAIAKPTGVKQ